MLHNLECRNQLDGTNLCPIGLPAGEVAEIQIQEELASESQTIIRSIRIKEKALERHIKVDEEKGRAGCDRTL